MTELVNSLDKPFPAHKASQLMKTVTLTSLCLLFLIFGTRAIPANASCYIGDYKVAPGNPIEISDPSIVTRITGKEMPQGSYLASCIKVPKQTKAEINSWGTAGTPQYEIAVIMQPSENVDPATAMIEQLEF